MSNKKRSLILAFAFVAFLLFLLSNTNLKSNKVQPPAYYANNPPQSMNCSFCHNGILSMDSTNFILQMGTDTLSLTNVTSGLTTYKPGMQYFMRVKATVPSPVYGFELTAEDSANNGTDVTNFSVLNPANTSLIAVAYNFVAHHNADSNNQWSFTWTAPTNYSGLITFYYAGNDGVAGDTVAGDHIFVVKKTIAAEAINGVTNIQDKITALTVFPAVFDDHIQISFNLKENTKIQGDVINLDGQLVKSILNEGLSAGNYSRSFDLSDLAKGIYLVKLQAGDTYVVSKIVKD